MKYLVILLLPLYLFGQPYEIYKPKCTTYFMAYDPVKRIYHIGKTEPQQVTTTGMPYFISDTSEVEFIKKINALRPVNNSPHTNLESLPPVNEIVEKNRFYLEDGKVVISRKEHIKEITENTNDAQLYISETIEKYPEWIEEEEINIGNIRLYKGIYYQAIKKHLTEIAPDKNTGYWKIIDIKIQSK